MKRKTARRLRARFQRINRERLRLINKKFATDPPSTRWDAELRRFEQAMDRIDACLNAAWYRWMDRQLAEMDRIAEACAPVRTDDRKGG